eukprot:gene817-9067_t
MRSNWLIHRLFTFILLEFVILGLILRLQYIPKKFQHFSQVGQFKDFSERYQCKPLNFFQPKNETDLLEFLQNVRSTHQTIRVVGGGHSMSPIAFSKHNLVNLDFMNKLIDVNTTSKQVTVQAGIRIKDIAKSISKYHLSLSNVGQITEQSIAGAISTSTHGSSSFLPKSKMLEFGSLSTQIVRMKILDAKGEFHYASKKENPDLFDAARCSLGALGIITEVTIQCQELHHLEIIESEENFIEVIQDYENYLLNKKYFRFWYIPYTNRSKVIYFQKTTEPKRNGIFNKIADSIGLPFVMNIISIARMFNVPPTEFISKYFFVKRNFIDRPDLVLTAPHPPVYSEIEYFFPIEKLNEVHKEFRKYVLSSKVYYNLISEIRFIAKDDIWLSPFYNRDSVAISVILYDLNSIWESYSNDLEKIFIKHQGRPHYGKHHNRNATNLKHEFEKWDDFLKIRNQMDPDGIFLNDYLKNIFGL